MVINKKYKNYKTLIAVQVIATVVLGLSLFFVSGESYKILATFPVVFGIGLLVQILLFYIIPGLFGEKVKRHPHEN